MKNLSINYYGALTLFKKETFRFFKVYHQTILAPVINALLFLAIFSLAFGKHTNFASDISFQEFIAAGLIMMTAMQNSFMNSSSSFMISKVMGHIIDYLMPPISAGELLLAITLSAVCRGLVVAAAVFIAIYIFIPFWFFDLTYVLFYIFFAASFLGMLGILAAVLSNTFDHMSAITSYFITPLTFLSGTFYSVKSLPPFWQNVTAFNPFFYMIDGFRYGITGYHDKNIALGMSVVIFFNILLGLIVYIILKKSYKIKN